MYPVSVCIITKNEENKLPRLLESLSPYLFEIVVVDTGSTDHTVELAKKYGAKVFSFSWCDDFAAARDYSLSCATNNWILMMDSDEWISSIDLEEMDYFRKHLGDKAGSVSRINLLGTPDNLTGKTVDYTERFFDRRRFHYTGRIHEQLTPKFGTGLDTLLMNITIMHDGYLMTARQRVLKGQRNIELLKKELSDNPESPYLHYQLGKGYEIISDHLSALGSFCKALSYPIDFSLAYGEDLALSFLREMTALYPDFGTLTDECVRLFTAFISSWNELFADFADFQYTLGQLALKEENFENALDRFEASLQCSREKTAGASSYLPYFEIGKLLLLIGEKEEAIRYFSLCQDYAPAKSLLSEL